LPPRRKNKIYKNKYISEVFYSINNYLKGDISMTREEWIEQYRFVVISVFKAEDKLRPQLKEVLEKYKDDKEKAAEIYSRMIAEEIVSHTNDEELEEL
jgi:hypothetical protein